MKPDANRLSLLEGVLGAVNLGAIVLDNASRVALWNRWMERHSRLAAADVVGRDFYAVFPELRAQRVASAVGQALHNNFPSLLSQTLNKSPFPLYADAAAAARGERMQQAVAVTPVTVEGAARHCLIQINDVSMAVGREKLLREQAMVLRSQTFSDGLTGIANRRHFDVAIDKEQRRAKRYGTALSLLMIDIDYFKPYNDHYGHQQGDQCLIQVAAALQGMLHRSADLLARYGGEEFAMILPDTDVQAALEMGEAVRQRAIEQRIPHASAGSEDKHITVSVGIATTNSGPDSLDVAGLIGAADRALYAAKRGGRNRVVAHTA
ncbi:sensor domain-containing diguanylate cyclase [Pseudoduganella namucuonensis]|uniref:diguanylate cyclase n=1 Tax=Pseudoduganella namucuonensis TaxID=1035707 RepID=A0A1I7M325_9BURK|nr:sensor domain-containing diguanylate cyclase [Pseudoduganella namucuonensis]SFV16315.1 diguanylate cyclase (GGDEF) domain-containing protein [Pseudoduganella namucuonensis]